MYMEFFFLFQRLCNIKINSVFNICIILKLYINYVTYKIAFKIVMKNKLPAIKHYIIKMGEIYTYTPIYLIALSDVKRNAIFLKQNAKVVM